MNGLRQLMSRWKAGDFFRQLATVIIGIMVTFGGSTLVQKSAERKEARHILDMVKEELHKNMEGIRDYRDQFEFDIEGYRAMKPYIVAGTPRQIPLDTLEKYRQVIVGINSYSAITNSFEALKTSPVVRAIDNTELMSELFRIYDLMAMAQTMTRGFMQAKEDGFKKIYSTMDVKTINDFFTSAGFLNVFEYMSTSEAGSQLRNFIVSVANGNNNYQVEIADGFIMQIGQVAEKIDKEIN